MHFFLSIRIFLSFFYLLTFDFEKFSTWIWRLPFAVHVKLKLSNMPCRYQMGLTECLIETIFPNVWTKTLPRKARSPLSGTFVAQKRLCLSSLFRNKGWRREGGGGMSMERRISPKPWSTDGNEVVNEKSRSATISSHIWNDCLYAVQTSN